VRVAKAPTAAIETKVATIRRIVGSVIDRVGVSIVSTHFTVDQAVFGVIGRRVERPIPPYDG